jgi:hypothetical protein
MEERVMNEPAGEKPVPDPPRDGALTRMLEESEALVKRSEILLAKPLRFLGSKPSADEDSKS